MRLLFAATLLIGTMASAHGEGVDFAETKAALEAQRVKLIHAAQELLAEPDLSRDSIELLAAIESGTNRWIEALREAPLARVWTTKAGRLQPAEVPWACLNWWASQIRTMAIDFKRAATLYVEHGDANFIENAGKNLRQIEAGSIYLPKCD